MDAQDEVGMSASGATQLPLLIEPTSAAVLLGAPLPAASREAVPLRVLVTCMVSGKQIKLLDMGWQHEQRSRNISA